MLAASACNSRDRGRQAGTHPAAVSDCLPPCCAMINHHSSMCSMLQCMGVLQTLVAAQGAARPCSTSQFVTCCPLGAVPHGRRCSSPSPPSWTTWQHSTTGNTWSTSQWQTAARCGWEWRGGDRAPAAGQHMEKGQSRQQGSGKLGRDTHRAPAAGQSTKGVCGGRASSRAAAMTGRAGAGRWTMVPQTKPTSSSGGSGSCSRCASCFPRSPWFGQQEQHMPQPQ